MKSGSSSLGQPPQYQLPPRDPLFDQLKLQADQDNVNATRKSIGADATSYAARFGFSDPVNFGSPISPIDATPPETKVDDFTKMIQDLASKGQVGPAAFRFLAKNEAFRSSR